MKYINKNGFEMVDVTHRKEIVPFYSYYSVAEVVETYREFMDKRDIIYLADDHGKLSPTSIIGSAAGDVRLVIKSHSRKRQGGALMKSTSFFTWFMTEAERNAVLNSAKRDRVTQLKRYSSAEKSVDTNRELPALQHDSNNDKSKLKHVSWNETVTFYNFYW